MNRRVIARAYTPGTCLAESVLYSIRRTRSTTNFRNAASSTTYKRRLATGGDIMRTSSAAHKAGGALPKAMRHVQAVRCRCSLQTTRYRRLQEDLRHVQVYTTTTWRPPTQFLLIALLPWHLKCTGEHVYRLCLRRRACVVLIAALYR